MLERLVVFGFLTVLVCSALAMGTVEPWSVALFEIATLTLTLLWTLKSLIDRKMELALLAPAWPLAGLVLLGICQSIAIPLSNGQRWTLSRDVEATRGAVAVIFFLFLLFLISSNFFATRERLKLLGAFLTAYGLSLAVFAIVQHFTWEGKLFWVREVQTASGYGGPFVNRNHFAGYMDMLAPVSAAMALVRGERSEVRLLYGFAAVIMGVSVTASLSRGGLISLAAGLLFVAVALSARRRGSSRQTGSWAKPVALISVILVSIAAGVFCVGADLGLANRLSSTDVQNPTSRYGIWRDSFKMVEMNPLTGVGLGAYETAFPMYSKSDGSQVVQFAHNDYLQALTDGGIVGGALAVWFLVALGGSMVRGMQSTDSNLRALAVGCSAGIFALLIHSFFDFNLQLPSNALLFLSLCSVVCRIAQVPRTVPAVVERSVSIEPRQLVRSAF